MSDIVYQSPSASILRGRADAVVVMLLWIARRASWAFLFAGVAVALWIGDVEEALGLDTIEEVVAALLSPLAPVALAIIFRIGVLIAGFLSAAALGAREVHEVPELHGMTRLRRLSSTWRVTLSHRARRWTWPVRDLAVAELGRAGRVFDIIDRSFFVATFAAVVGLVVVVFVQP